MPFTVQIFSINQAYGGPEEGGWWFTYGCPVERSDQLPGRITPQRRFKRLAAARSYARRINNQLAKSNDDLNSVNCDEHFSACVCVGRPVPFPRYRPHYE